MSVQLQVTTREDAQWSAMAVNTGTGAAAGTAVLSAPVGWAKIFAMRVQYPAGTAAPAGLTGFIELQYVQNGIVRLPDNTDPIRVPVTDDTEVCLYTPPNSALNLQFNISDLRALGVLMDNKGIRLSVLHTLTKC